MDKILTIASREYKAAVRSKAFILTMLMMPIMMSGSIVVQILLEKIDVKDQKIAVIDRSPGGTLVESLKVALKSTSEAVRDLPKEVAEQLEQNPQIMDALKAKFIIENVPPSESTPEAILNQRYELSKRVEGGELDGIIEIGSKVFEPFKISLPDAKSDDDHSVRLQFKNPIEGMKFQTLSQLILDKLIQAKRMEMKKIKIGEMVELLANTPIIMKPMTVKNKLTGEISEGKKGAQIVNLFLPLALVLLMFMLVMVGATPAMQGIVEEKTQRIAEVLLGSVSPFQLMSGKLVGLIGVALTMAAVYLTGGYVVAWKYGYAEMLPPALIVWFCIFTVMELLIFGSVFMAIGAAAVEIKDTQTLMMPIMVIVCLPLFALSKIINDPNGMVATAASFFPFGAPMVLVARQSVPPGVPLWQMLTGIFLVLATTVFCVWAAGRIFRVGILMHGKGAKLGEMIKWVIKG